jgi:hypothetical protein
MISMYRQNARPDDVSRRHAEHKPYVTPELRELGSLKEITLGQVSGNREDSLMKLEFVAG